MKFLGKIKSTRLLGAVLLVLVAPRLQAEAGDDETGWSPLFNGKDLSGWFNVNCAPNTFSVRDGLLVTTGIPTGVMHSERQYENFELELEWSHMKEGGN